MKLNYFSNVKFIVISIESCTLFFYYVDIFNIFFFKFLQLVRFGIIQLVLYYNPCDGTRRISL